MNAQQGGIPWMLVTDKGNEITQTQHLSKWARTNLLPTKTADMWYKGCVQLWERECMLPTKQLTCPKETNRRETLSAWLILHSKPTEKPPSLADFVYKVWAMHAGIYVWEYSLHRPNHCEIGTCITRNPSHFWQVWQSLLSNPQGEPLGSTFQASDSERSMVIVLPVTHVTIPAKASQAYS